MKYAKTIIYLDNYKVIIYVNKAKNDDVISQV